MSMGKCWSNGL